jgi:hypothetical protein
MQQGRVQLDSDWNEWLAELTRRIQAGTLDILGRAVYPATTPHAFEITALSSGSTNTLLIGPGRMYVDGLGAENHGNPAAAQWDPALGEMSDAPQPPLASATTDAVDYTQQPYMPPKTTLPPGNGPFLAYLDVWVRPVDYINDLNLIDSAVGVDSTGRLQTVWQVWLKDLSNSPGATCDSPIDGWPPAPSAGLLSTNTTPTAPSGPCCLTSGAAYTGLENQLYRVEIHQPGKAEASAVPPAIPPSGIATFKWSRDNGSVTTGVTSISNGKNQLTVLSLGRDQVLGFGPGNWIEILDDSTEFGQTHGELHKIDTIDFAAKTITLATALGAGFPAGNQDPSLHTRIRRWDQSGKVYEQDGTTVWWDIDAQGGADIPVPPSGTWLILENGITVSFDLRPATGGFNTGDFWTFAARTATGLVEKLDQAAPRGIHHHYARLSIVTFGNPATDCRHVWPPLTEPVQAFHVIAISWSNDEFLDANTLGLAIAFDAPPDPSTLNNGAFVVSVEVIREDPTVAGGASLRDVFVLDGVWQMISTDPPVVNCTGDNLFNALIAFQNAPTGQEARVRVRLMGSKIWTSPGNVYLDGQAFGKAGTRRDGTTRIDLNLPPSGSGAKASDFESWFYLLAMPTSPLQVTHVQLKGIGGVVLSDIDPPHKAPQDQILIIAGLQEAVITFNRPPDPGSVTVNTVFVFDGAGTKSRVQGTLTVSGNTVHLGLGNPIVAGSLEVAGGVDNSFTPQTSPVTAQDDGTALDGDYDSAAGGDFVLPFSVD